MSRRLPYLMKNLAALFLGCLVSLILLEGILQLYNPFITRTKGSSIVLPTNKVNYYNRHTTRGIEQDIIHTRNGIGFRGPELPPGGLKGYLSFFTIGGSTTECRFISDGKDWTSLLGELINEDYDSVWYNNAGLEGHTTFGHYILYEDYIAPLAPKFIIFLVGINDVGLASTDDYAERKMKGRIRFDAWPHFLKDTANYSEVMALIDNAYHHWTARKRGLVHRDLDLNRMRHLDYTKAQLDSTLNAHREKVIPYYRERLTRLVRRVEQDGVIPILMTQPVLYGEGVDPETGVDLETLEIVPGSPGGISWAVLQEYNQVTRDVAGEENVLLIDLANETAKNSLYYYDMVHLTIAGNQVIAEAIFEELKPFLDAHFAACKRVQ